MRGLTRHEAHNETNIAAGLLEWADRLPLSVAPGFTPPCNHLPHSGVLEQDTNTDHPQKCCPVAEPDPWPGDQSLPGINGAFHYRRILWNEMNYRCGHRLVGGAERVCVFKLHAWVAKTLLKRRSLCGLIWATPYSKCVCVCVCEITWYKIGVRRAWPCFAGVSRALVSSRKQDIAVTHTQLGSVGVTVGPLGPAGPALWKWQRQHISQPVWCVSICSCQCVCVCVCVCVCTAYACVPSPAY